MTGTHGPAKRIRVKLIMRIFKKERRAHVRPPENVVGKPFAALCFAGSSLRCWCDPDHLRDDVSCVRGEDIAGVGWLPKFPKWQQKLCELQAIHSTVLLHGR
jgi:hypothetical protein